MEDKAITKKNLWFFPLGTVGRDMVYNLVTSYLLAFVLYTKGLNAAQLGVITIIMIAARVFDALNDPIMGNIIERTRSRWGKFKPWLVIGILTTSVVIYLTFNLTLMPMVTPLNRLVTVMARYDEESDTYVEGSRNAIWGDVRLNYTTRGAVAWSFGRCCASITASYDTFTFQSSKSQDKNFAQVHSLETKAVFDKWQVNFRVNFHF